MIQKVFKELGSPQKRKKLTLLVVVMISVFALMIGARFFCVMIKGLRNVNSVSSSCIVPPFDVRGICRSNFY